MLKCLANLKMVLAVPAVAVLGFVLYALVLFYPVAGDDAVYTRVAAALLKRAADWSPRDWQARLRLARAYAGALRDDEALREYSASLQIMTEYVKKAGFLAGGSLCSRSIKTAYYERGRVLFFKGDRDGSSRDYFSALAVHAQDSTGFEVREINSRILNDLALNMLRCGNNGRAEKYFKLAVAANANNVDGLNNLGLVFLKKNDRNMARFWFERVQKVRPGFGPAWDNLKKLELGR